MPVNLIILSLTVGLILVGWGALLSPPFESIRNVLNIQLPPDGRAVMIGGQEVAAICNPDPAACQAYLSRLVFLYHSVFAIVLAMVVYAAAVVFDFNNEYRKPVLALTTMGYLMTVVGGILYGYWIQDLSLHGIFITGLALMFGAGLLFVLGIRVRENGKIDLLSLNLLLAAALLLVTSFIGGWLGANQPTMGNALGEAVALARRNPDLGEGSLPWRAMTVHQHGMVAILGAAVTFLLFKHFKVNSESKLIKTSLVLAAVGQLIMAGAVWLVVPYGSPAHLAITPASVVLLTAVGLICLADLTTRAKLIGVKSLLTKDLKRATSYLLVLGIWPAVAIPGAMVAISLRNPIFFKPEFRDSVWDWAENAFSIGHWHILIFIFGATLFILFLDLFGSGRLRNVTAGLMGASALAASIMTNLYMLPASPRMYIPNPYNNSILTYFVEPALGAFSLSLVLGYVSILGRFMKAVTT